MTHIIPDANILDKVIFFRWKNIMLDKDLAYLFGTETRKLKQAVRRNIERFPEDFMFELSEDEIELMVSQSVIPSKSYFWWALPFVFTEHWLLMLANVLKSDQAIQMSINIVRIFAKMRDMLQKNDLLNKRLREVEQKLIENDQQFAQIWFEIKKMLALETDDNTRKIGFKVTD